MTDAPPAADAVQQPRTLATGGLPARRVRPGAREPSIAVIDDDPANVLLLDRLLERTGYRDVATWTDPEEAVGALLARPPDLLLLDLRMPVLDGYGVLERLASLLAPPHELAVLVLTADLTTQTRHRALAAGARDFVTKPFDLVELALRVDNLVETAELHRRLRAQNDRLESAVAARTAELVRLASDLAHDVRTPLYAIRGTAEVLLDFEDGLPDALRADLRRIDDDAHAALRLLDDGIASARAVAGRVLPAPAPVAVSAVLAALRDAMAPVPEAAGRLTVADGADAGAIVTDVPRLAQVLRTLVADALGGPAGAVAVAVERPADGATVAFHVDRPGGPDDERAVAEAAPGHGAPEAGFGIPIARRVAQGLGGDVEVRRRPDGGVRLTATIAARLATSVGDGPDG